MKIQCGTDIIEVSRIKDDIEKFKEDFLNRVYTKKEIDYCNSKNVNKYQHFAARYAAKEAIFKAISIFIDNKYSLTWQDIEILNDENGRPYVVLNTNKIGNNISIDISLSHIKEYAIAYCIVIVNE